MISVRNPTFPTLALLSVAGDISIEQDALNAVRSPDLAGLSLIEYQIMMLARAGIQRFLIEVENIDGSLIALADRCRLRKLTVDFVRTGADILRHIDPEERIWVQSGQLYVQLGLIETLLKCTENFIATIDGRDENHAFERIDINTRWAGVSVVGYDAVVMLRDLPEDWSIISSLLRQSLFGQSSVSSTCTATCSKCYFDSVDGRAGFFGAQSPDTPATCGQQGRLYRDICLRTNFCPHRAAYLAKPDSGDRDQMRKPNHSIIGRCIGFWKLCYSRMCCSFVIYRSERVTFDCDR